MDGMLLSGTMDKTTGEWCFDERCARVFLCCTNKLNIPPISTDVCLLVCFLSGICHQRLDGMCHINVYIYIYVYI